MRLSVNFCYKFLFFIILFFAGLQVHAENKFSPVSISSSVGGDFTLHSARGDINLADYRGKVVLLYFGYINCPDACPTTLSQWAKAFRKLSVDELNKVQGIMISVDPERDSLTELDAFAGFFHENIVAISGSLEELYQVTKLFGTDFKIQDHKPGKNYGVDHSFHVYVINPQGKVTYQVDFTTDIDQLVSLIRSLLH